MGPAGDLEGRDLSGAFAASQGADHCGLAVPTHGEAYQQVPHWCEDLVRELGCRDADAYREVVTMHDDLQHAGEQEVTSHQRPPLPRNQHDVPGTTVSEQATHRLERRNGPVVQRPGTQLGFSIVGAAIVGGITGELDVTHAALS